MTTIAASLIYLRLKGFVKPETLGVMGDALVSQGWADTAKLGLRLTADGRAAADAAWQDERSGSDSVIIEAAHSQFVAVNPGFKALVAKWQLRDGIPNDHADPVYDRAIIDELEQTDTVVQTVLVLVSGQVPRMARYAALFSDALVRVKAGEIRWMAAPVIDSYHTLWFELHEELIRLSGRTRAAEAATGAAA